MTGPAGAIAGAALGPVLEPLVSGVWAEMSGKARQHQTSTLFWAIHYGFPSRRCKSGSTPQTKLSC
jgi:hypothetical protein